MSATVALVFARCAGCVFRAPGFSHPSVPPSVRVAIALTLAMLLAPGVHARGWSVLTFALALPVEFGLGAAIGFGASVLYDGAYAAGRALDDYAGIRGSVPGAALAPASGFGRLWSLAFLAAYFLLDGYRMVIAAFAEDLERFPPGTLLGTMQWAQYAVALPALIFKAAVLICGPAVAALFVVQFTLGALSRTIPRLNSFTLSFPLAFGAALIMTLISIPLAIAAAGRPWLLTP